MSCEKVKHLRNQWSKSYTKYRHEKEGKSEMTDRNCMTFDDADPEDEKDGKGTYEFFSTVDRKWYEVNLSDGELTELMAAWRRQNASISHDVAPGGSEIEKTGGSEG